MRYKIVSEKVLERRLSREVKTLGGWTIKLLSYLVRGLPDRLVLIQGLAFFCEIKTTGKEPPPAQLLMHKKLKKLGFTVYLIDSHESLNEFLKIIKNRIL